MAYWSSEKLKDRIPGGRLVTPYDENRVTHCAYELAVGDRAFVTSNPSDKTLVAAEAKIVIPPGQFGLLITQETVAVPKDCIAFISIRAGSKFQGLVNVSGFHVDPGYKGRLMFAVYNAGSMSIVLDQGQRLFMIWFADLDRETEDTYKKPGREGISAEDVMKIQGEVASPAELKKRLDDMKADYDKRLYDLKTESDKKLYEMKLDFDKKFHAVEQSQLWNRWLYGVLVGVGVSLFLSIIGWIFIKPIFDRSGKKNEPANSSQAAPQPQTPSTNIGSEERKDRIQVAAPKTALPPSPTASPN